MQRARSTDAYHIQRAVVRLDSAGLEVDVGGDIEFGEDDVDIVAAHTGTHRREAVPVIVAGYGMYFAVTAFIFNLFEQVLEKVDSVGVANQEDVVGQFVAVGIDVIGLA